MAVPSLIVAHRIFTCGMWDPVPQTGIQLLHWELRVLATGPPGKSKKYLLNEQKLVGVRVTHKLRETFPSSPQMSELGFTTFYIYTSPSLKTSRSPEMSRSCPYKVPTPPLTMVGELELELKALAVKPDSFHPFQEFPWPQCL